MRAIVIIVMCICISNGAYSQKKGKPASSVTQGKITSIGTYTNVQYIEDFYSDVRSKSTDGIIKTKYETEEQYQARLPKADTNQIVCLMIRPKDYEVKLWFDYNAEQKRMNVRIGGCRSGTFNAIQLTTIRKINKYKAVTRMGAKFEAEEIREDNYGLSFTSAEYTNLKKTILIEKSKSDADKECYFSIDTIVSPEVAKYCEENLIPCITGYIYNYNSRYEMQMSKPDNITLFKPTSYESWQNLLKFKPNSLILYDPKKKEIFKEIKFR